MIGLTPRQRELLAFIERCPVPPTFEEMGEALGYRTTHFRSVIHYHLTALEEKGRIHRWPRVARGIEIVAPLHPVIINNQRYRFIPLERVGD